MNLNLLLVAVTALCFSLHAVFAKLASGKIDPFSGLFFWALGGLGVGGILFMGQRLWNAPSISVQGATYSAVAGGVLALGIAAYMAAFRRGVDFSFATPIVNISVVVMGVVFGFLLFQEQISITRLAGIFCGALAIILISRG